MSEELKLPSIPEGLVLTGGNAGVLYVGGRPADTRSAYTAEQMRELQRQTVEMCAAICEAESLGHRMAFGEHCAAVIHGYLKDHS